MNCQKCNSERIIHVQAKCSELCTESLVNLAHRHQQGYVSSDIGLDSGGDYIRLKYCLECGQIQGKFPLPLASIELDNEESRDLEGEKIL